MKTLFTSVLLIVFLFSAQAQEMTAGFKYLETGQNQKAALFFAEILKEYPENKTAQLCYARALGLGGNPAEALELFKEMRVEYPGDLEINLNYAEAFLWNNDFKKAVPVYKELVKNNPENFGALLGYANTLSNLKKYDAALTYIKRALSADPGNANALVSRKYIRLGKAGQLAKANQIDRALALLDSNLIDFPNDRDTELNKIAIYLPNENFEEATRIYSGFNTSTKDSVTGKIGLALVSHLAEKDKKALTFATEAFNMAQQFKKDSLVFLPAAERYTQALVWNAKYAEAKQEITTLSEDFPQHKTVLALQAMLGMYTGDFKTSLEAYQTILSNDSTSFDGNLGIANAYRAADNPLEAYTYAQKTLTYYEGQKDALGLITKLDLSYAPVVGTRASVTKDNGENTAYSYGINIALPFSTAFKTEALYGYRTTRNGISGQEAHAHELGMKLNYMVAPGFELETQAGFIKAFTADKDYTDVQGSLSLKTKPAKRQNLEVGYRRALQNFNAELIEEKIALNDYFLNYNWGITTRLGWYTSMIYTAQSDANNRKLLFTSLYYGLTKKPALKMGFNYQYLGYKNQVNMLYFSPSKYQATEVFADLMLNDLGSFQIHAVAAGGYQFVESQKATSIFRAELNVNYTLSSQFNLGFYAKYSNIASAVASGFEFGEAGITLRWLPFSKPMFKK
ncbi:tetratricopeptide repeat protein [Leeuwenhoekiella polynyae]|uniref:Tetratricopeptide repeat protein n=1 Tax=Leeuwenhoekiella polynyae TaxID=1550906 RepID=A0A4Q0P5P8_9FLAO|nr:tetratricopeptide repeat protein [Leeuwenhoekiella polynyae]RXG21761.1 tetratricopeptide repeat protein [Leeuwenhoekiella polynyae]